MPVNLAADVQAFTSNVFLCDGATTALVDTGANFDVVPRIRDHVDAIDRVVITHTHDDHIGNVDRVRDAFGVETVGWDADQRAVDRSVDDGATLDCGDGTYEVLFTPGHAPDHLCLYDASAGVLFAGDLVFGNGGVGRTDLPGSDHAALVESVGRIRDRCGDGLRALHAGHGPSVTDDPAAVLDRAAQLARF